MDHPFVVDGHERARDAIERVVRQRVETAYAAALANANAWQRIRIRMKIRRAIEREVRKRLAEQAPDDALYAVSRPLQRGRGG